jgi:hypothetical protein
MEEGTQSVQSYYPKTYLMDISTRSISTICSAVTAESSTNFNASSSLQVATKPSPTASRSAQGYRDFKIPRVKLADCFMLARIISRDLVGRLSNI